MSIPDEATRRVGTRVQPSLMTAAQERARQVYPHAGESVTVRLALARLAGLTDEYGAELSRAPRTRGQRTRKIRTEPST